MEVGRKAYTPHTKYITEIPISDYRYYFNEYGDLIRIVHCHVAILVCGFIIEYTKFKQSLVLLEDNGIHL